MNELALEIKKGNRRALAKGITLIESQRDDDYIKAQELLALLIENRDTVRIGISGVPGVGKSTFIESLGTHLIDNGKKVAVLAVDPSSPTSGGSILGDKIRMETLATRKEAFIRPSPTSGTLGGVTKRTRESIILCEAAGYDTILIETVGVGQSEFEVASMVDCFLVLMLPGAGDSLQGIKRGILEITDLLVINKADGDQARLAKRTASEYGNAFHLLKPKYENISVDICTVSALENRGIKQTWVAVMAFIDKLKSEGLFESIRKNQYINWFKRLAEDELVSGFWHNTAVMNEAHSQEIELRYHRTTPVLAAKKILEVYRGIRSEE